MRYAIQVLFEGHWHYVMDSNGETVITFSDHAGAVAAMRTWEHHSTDEPAARVVRY